MPHWNSISLVVRMLICGLAPGESKTMSFDQAAAALQESLNGVEVQSDTHTPSKPNRTFVAG